MYMYMYVYTYIYIFMDVYTHTHTHTHKALSRSLSHTHTLSLSLSHSHTHTHTHYIHTGLPPWILGWSQWRDLTKQDSALIAPRFSKKKISHEVQCTALILISPRILAGRNVKESSPPDALASTRQVVILHSFLVLFFFCTLFCAMAEA